MDESKPLEKIRNWEHPPWYGRVQVEERVTLTFLENQKDLFHNFMTHFRLPVKLWTTFWSMSGSFIYRHHVEPRVALYSPREEIIPYSTEIHWTSPETAHTNLDVKLEQRIDDYWNIDGSRELSDPWTGFTQFTQLEEKNLPTDICGLEGDWREKKLTSRPDHLWPELWKSMGKERQAEGEAKSGLKKRFILTMHEKLRGIYFIDPEDKEYKETIKNARKKLETSVALAMPCKNYEELWEWTNLTKNKTKTCVYSGSQWIRQDAYGEFWTTYSRRSYCRKRWEFIAAL